MAEMVAYELLGFWPRIRKQTPSLRSPIAKILLKVPLNLQSIDYKVHALYLGPYTKRL